MVDYFVVDVLQNVFNIDASETIRPMTHYVESPTDIDHLFDAIAYDKCKLLIIITETNIIKILL